MNFTQWFSKLLGRKEISAPAPEEKLTSPQPIAAKVMKIEKHPNADRLRVITLDTGEGIVGPVICGAFNFNEGDIVALALPGTVIARNIHSDAHESFTLGKATIRGVESNGMICAAFELGLSEDTGTGVMVLPAGTPLGSHIA
jgi:phenylalanyl-tRNA synthetase beta chain